MLLYRVRYCCAKLKKTKGTNSPDGIAGKVVPFVHDAIILKKAPLFSHSCQYPSFQRQGVSEDPA